MSVGEGLRPIVDVICLQCVQARRWQITSAFAYGNLANIHLTHNRGAHLKMRLRGLQYCLLLDLAVCAKRCPRELATALRPSTPALGTERETKVSLFFCSVWQMMATSIKNLPAENAGRLLFLITYNHSIGRPPGCGGPWRHRHFGARHSGHQSN